MGGPREIEIKLALADAATGRRLLRTAGFRVFKRRVFEANTIFDTARGGLRRTGRMLRVRAAGPTGTLTYKGPGATGQYKEREELEVKVNDPRRLSEIVTCLDFKPAFRYEKYRTEYRRRGEAGVATLDETPIGVYMELEGTPAWIDRSAHRLGFAESDYSTASYYGLYVDYCRRLGVPVTHMTFAKEDARGRGA